MLRKELRDLMQFLGGGGKQKPKIFTKLDEPVINAQEGQALGAAYDFADYRKKVNCYVEEHKEDPIIYKLNQKQIEFILKIINHIESNGYIEDVKILMKPPFDKPYSFIKMFDQKTRTALIQTIEAIKNNALNVVA